MFNIFICFALFPSHYYKGEFDTGQRILEEKREDPLQFQIPMKPREPLENILKATFQK